MKNEIYVRGITKGQMWAYDNDVEENIKDFYKHQLDYQDKLRELEKQEQTQKIKAEIAAMKKRINELNNKY